MSGTNLSLVPNPEPSAEPAGLGQVQRAARALIGWMRPQDAEALLSSAGISSSAGIAAIPGQGQAARQAVTARPTGIDQDGLVATLPAGLDDHVRALRESPAAGPMFAGGWQVALVDLTRVAAFQPVVLTDQAASRVQAVDGDDVASVAAVTLPLVQSVQLPVQFDPIRSGRPGPWSRRT
jgi:hypothetical protein